MLNTVFIELKDYSKDIDKGLLKEPKLKVMTVLRVSSVAVHNMVQTLWLYV